MFARVLEHSSGVIWSLTVGAGSPSKILPSQCLVPAHLNLALNELVGELFEPRHWQQQG